MLQSQARMNAWMNPLHLTLIHQFIVQIIIHSHIIIMSGSMKTKINISQRTLEFHHHRPVNPVRPAHRQRLSKLQLQSSNSRQTQHSHRSSNNNQQIHSSNNQLLSNKSKANVSQRIIIVVIVVVHDIAQTATRARQRAIVIKSEYLPHVSVVMNMIMNSCLSL